MKTATEKTNFESTVERVETFDIRRSEERGKADHGWLKSNHSFSFGGYFDPSHMGFRSLRVINQDTVAVGGGFPTHPHADMEIFSYVLEGVLEHKDSMGNGSQLRPGQIQLMSAGTGVTHSEYNGSDSKLHFLQIWLTPKQNGLKPRYSEWHPTDSSETAPKVLIISSDGRENSAQIAQDADIYRLKFPEGQSIEHKIEYGRGVWIQLIKGNLSVNGRELKPGDAISTETAGLLEIEATDGEVEALLFDIG